MMARQTMFALAALLSAPIGASAATFDAIDKVCREDEAVCRIYFSALAEGVSMAAAYANAIQVKKPFCIPPTTGPRAMGEVVKNYVYAHPEQWHVGTAVMGLLALTDAFPCP